MVARGAAAVGGARGRGSGSTGGRIRGRGARENQVARRHITRAALRLNSGLRTPERGEHQQAAPEVIPSNVPEAFMRMMRSNLAGLRRQLNEERQRGIQLEAQATTHEDGNESTNELDYSDYEVEEDDQSEEESLLPEEEEDIADEHPVEEV